MKLSSRIIEQKGEQALCTCLEKIPFLKIEEIKRDGAREDLKLDFIIKVALPKGEWNLVAEVKNNGQPRFARQAVNQLLRYRDIIPDYYGVFIAPYISSEAAQICTQARIGYIDFSGNCLLSFGQVYIEQVGRPNLFAEKRDLRSLYSPKAERVLRVLLNNPKKVWKLKDLAAEAEVSLGQASNVKKLLSDREWLNITTDGLILSEPKHLLEVWVENYNFRKNKISDYYSMKQISDIEADLADMCNQKGLKYALTSFSGAARLAPTVRYQRAMVYIEETEKDITSFMDLKKVQSGANISILTPYDEGVFYDVSEFDGLRIASPIQIYLDLVGFRGRGEEAATAILEEVILPKW